MLGATGSSGGYVRGCTVRTIWGPRNTSWALALVVAICASSGALTALSEAPAHADGPGVGSPWIVSVGDSAISGEAGRWAGNTNGKPKKIDALGRTAYFDNAT